MARRNDPQNARMRHLDSMIDLVRKVVIDIGAGDGEMTWRYASRAARVIGVDPGPVATFTPGAAARRRRNVDFVRGRAEALPFDDGRFDVAIFSWSL